jgi:hypothetical protein
MHPVPGERFYIDQSAQDRAATVAATAGAARIAAQAAASAAVMRSISSTVGATVGYSKVTLDFGDLLSTEDAPSQWTTQR